MWCPVRRLNLNFLPFFLFLSKSEFSAARFVVVVPKVLPILLPVAQTQSLEQAW
jgi:hypothetical protein